MARTHAIAAMVGVAGTIGLLAALHHVVVITARDTSFCVSGVSLPPGSGGLAPGHEFVDAALLMAVDER